MKMLATGLCALVMLSSLILAAEPQVTLTQGKESVKVMIGDDVFAVYRYGTGRRKPFFLPVTGPGGFELLQKAVASEPAEGLGRKVMVASESVTLSGTKGDPVVVNYGEVLEISKVDDNQLWAEAQQGWISRADVAPLAAIVTRLINDDPAPSMDKYSKDKYDHPHHKGVWFAVDEINEIRFWMEGSLVRSQGVKIEGSGTSAAKIHFVNHWLSPEDKPVLTETTTVTITPQRLLTYETTLTAAADEVHIGDTKEGMLAIRLPGSMTEKNAKGPVTNSEGLKTTVAAWGKTARWVNYDGPIDGHIFGVTLMDSSTNPWPSRYHVRDYGLFAVNPFGAGSYTAGTPDAQPKHARTLRHGESLHFKYGLWIHGDDVNADQIQTVYDHF